MNNTEFENLLLLLENESTFELGIILAQNYKQEFEQYFGVSFEKYKKFDELYLISKSDKSDKIFVGVDWLGEFGCNSIKILQLYRRVHIYRYKTNEFLKNIFWQEDGSFE